MSNRLNFKKQIIALQKKYPGTTVNIRNYKGALEELGEGVVVEIMWENKLFSMDVSYLRGRKESEDVVRKWLEEMVIDSNGPVFTITPESGVYGTYLVHVTIDRKGNIQMDHERIYSDKSGKRIFK